MFGIALENLFRICYRVHELERAAELAAKKVKKLEFNSV